jgi:hypothetical protein
MPIPIQIGRFRFASKAAAERHFQQLLHKTEYEGEFVGEDRELLEAAVLMRADKVAEIGGRQITRIYRAPALGNTGRPLFGTSCFWVAFDTGKPMDFSFMKLLAATDRAA